MESVETYDLVVFLAVARAGSFGGAATDLRLATPSVSTRMAALERKVGTELFIRTARGSKLTRGGEVFRSYAERCLNLLEEAHHSVRIGSRERSLIAAPASLGATLFAPVLQILQSAEITAHGRVADSYAVIDYLLDRSADVGFVVNGVIPSTMLTRRVSNARLLAVAGSDHWLSRQREVTLHDMLQTKIAVYRWNAEAEVLADTFDHPRRAPEFPIQMLGLPWSILELVEEHGYVGIVPEFSVAQELRRSKLRLLRLDFPTWMLHVDMVHTADVAETTTVRVLNERLDEVAATVSWNPGSSPSPSG